MGFIFSVVGISFIADVYDLSVAIQTVAWISLRPGIFVLLAVLQTRKIDGTTEK